MSSPVKFGHSAMGRLAAGFARRYPDVPLEVTVEDRELDLTEEGYDAVIRVNARPDSELVGRCFARDQLLLVGPPSLTCPDAGALESSGDVVPAVVGVNAPDLDTWTVRAGAGAAVLAQDLVASHLAEGRLVSWGAVPDRSVALWVLHTSRRLTSRKVAAFVQFLCDAEGATERRDANAPSA